MRSQIISLAAWLFIFVTIFSRQGKAIIDIKPSDTVVLRNGSTYFNCSTFNVSADLEVISWYHKVGDQSRKEVYENGKIFAIYRGRFRVEKDLSKGVVNLIVEAPTLEDAGTYQCVDERGVGKEAVAQLTVLETEPICHSNINQDGVIGPNDCGIPPDQVQMSCSITYRGSSPVELEWRNGLENDNLSPIFECSNTTNRTTCNLTVTGDHIRSNSIYVCQTKNTAKNTFSCSSDAIRILYAMNNSAPISTTNQDEYICSANSSQQCSYTWVNPDGTIVSTTKSLKPAKSGQHTCKANCALRGQTCLVIARNLNISVEITPASAETKTGETGSTAIIAGTIIGVIVIIAAIVAIVSAILVWRRCKKEKIKRDAKTEAIPLQAKTKEKEDNSTASAHPYVSVDPSDSTVLKVPDDFVFENIFNTKNYIDKGLSGDIYGPGQYKEMQCACERIMFSADQLLPTDKGEMTKEEKTRCNGEKWMKLDHDNLIKFYGVILQPPAFFIIMEYAAGGSVRKILNTCRENLQIKVVTDWATQIAQGMSYLHEKSIIHKALKSAQVLIMEPFHSTTRVTLKVASYSLTFGDKTNPATFKGMFAWMAPEAIKESNYSNSSDIWSFGVTVWEILTRGIPHSERRDGEIIREIPIGKLSLDIPKSCPQILHNILTECFYLDPEARPAFSKVLSELDTLNAKRPDSGID